MTTGLVQICYELQAQNFELLGRMYERAGQQHEAESMYWQALRSFDRFAAITRLDEAVYLRYAERLLPGGKDRDQ